MSAEVATLVMEGRVQVSTSDYETCRQWYKSIFCSSNCVDIDECSQGNPCPANSNCANTDGSFVCTCLPGFREQREGGRLQCNGMCLRNPIVVSLLSLQGQRHYSQLVHLCGMGWLF